MTLAFIGIGSNLGDRVRHLRCGVDGIRASECASLCAVSPVFETEPLGGPEQGDYLNAALAIEWSDDAGGLLTRLLEIERDAGRIRGERDGPRILDLDLLLFGAEVIDEPELRVPHPRLHERAFVLEPLGRLAADFIHPVLGERIATLSERARDEQGVRPFADASLLVR